MSSKDQQFESVVAELSGRVDAVREDLREALDATLPALDGARACGRALGLKRGLGWKIYSVATASDLPTALGALPRRSGWAMVIQSLREARCPASKLRALERSVDALQSRLESGEVKRSMLRAIAAGQLDNPRQTMAMLDARRSVREGSETVFGVRCALQVGMYVISAADARGSVSLATSNMYDDLRRLRPGPPIAIKSFTRAWHPSTPEDIVASPMGADPTTGWLVSDLSSPRSWGTHVGLESDVGSPVVCLHGGIGADLRIVFAEQIPGAGTVGHADDRVDLHFGISIPTARCIFEVWIHRSIALRSQPAAGLAGTLDSALPMSQETELIPLPLEVRAERIDRVAPPKVSRSITRVHAEMVGRCATAMRTEPDELVGYRVDVPDPPIGTKIRLRWRM
jgi:hypothetical protein